MKYSIQYFVSLCLVLVSLLNTTGFAQNNAVEVKKSTEKVIISGKKYYIHTVKKGENLFSISNAYEVSQDEISAVNSGAAFGLKVGQALKIPVKEVQQETSNNDQPGNEAYIIHKVKTGESLYFLSRKYNMDMDKILEYNPDMSYNITEGQLVRIPRNLINTRTEISQEQIADETDYKIVEIKKDDTLYSLSKQYNVTVEDMVALNPELIEGLKLGQQIKIPINLALTFDNTSTEFSNINFDTAGVYTEQLISTMYPPCRGKALTKNETYHVAIMLPFNIMEQNKYTITETENTAVNSTEAAPKTATVLTWKKNFTEFYEGALLAIDSLKKSGAHVKVYVYDTQKNKEKVEKILNSSEFQNINLIIGPVYPEIVKLVSEYSKTHRIPMVSPLSNNPALIKDNPYLIQVIPSEENEKKYTAFEIAKTSDKYHILLVHPGDSLIMKNIYDYRDNIFQFYSEQRGQTSNLSYTEILFNDKSKWTIKPNLKADKPNLVFIPSESEAYVNKVISNLFLYYKDYDITLFGLSEWARFKSVDLNYLHQMRLHYVSPFFVDYQNSRIKEFIKKYRNTYHTEPSETGTKGYTYAYLGFDISYYFIGALTNYGPDFIGCIKEYNLPLLQTNFSFEKNGYFNGYENKTIKLIQFMPDYSISVTK